MCLALCIAAFPSLMTYLQLIPYTFPQGDDFGLAYNINTQGFWGSITNALQEWSGRYAAFWYWSVAYSWHAWVRDYWVFIAFVFFLQFAGWSILIWNLEAKLFSYMQSAALAIPMMVACLQISPQPAQTFYWFSGAAPYQLPFALFLIQMGSVLRLLRQKEPSYRNPFFYVALLATFLLIGGNESLIILDLLLLFYAVFMARRYSARNSFQLVFILILALCCTIAVASAAGNTGRMQSNDASGQLSPAVQDAFLLAFRILYMFFNHAWIWVLTFLSIILWRRKDAGITPETRKILQCNAMAFLAAMLIFSWASGAIYVYGLGSAVLPGRVYNLAMQVLTVCWLGAVYSAARLGAGKIPPLLPPGIRSWRHYPYWLVFALILVTATIYQNHQYGRARHDLLMAPLYKDEHIRWHTMLTRNADANPVLRSIRAKPFHLYYMDPEEDPGFWINKFMAWYYGKETITVSGTVYNPRGGRYER